MELFSETLRGLPTGRLGGEVLPDGSGFLNAAAAAAFFVKSTAVLLLTPDGDPVSCCGFTELILTGVTGTGGTMVSNSGVTGTAATGIAATGTGVDAIDVDAGVELRFKTLATNRFLLVMDGVLFSSESVLGVRVIN